MVTMVDLKFTGHSLVFYITRHTKKIKNKIKKLKIKLNITFFLKILKKKKFKKIKKKKIKKNTNENIKKN